MTSKFEEFLDARCRMLDDDSRFPAPGSRFPDIEVPDDDKIWKGISAELGKTRRLRIGLLSVAALILLMITSGVAVTLILKQRKAAEANFSLQNVSKQLGEEETFFRLTVLQKIDEVKKSGVKGDDYYAMMEQLNQIDRHYESYMTDLQELGNQPKILKGIIRCYELKIKVIETTLKETEKNKHYENEKHIL
ncbi:MAG: hypothetical protein NTY96_00220 [Bacteroidetes bacterium]|nr:hypothetical protein [Bacteroidota bacterium]